MPWLEEIGYSREATITAVREYYQFLTKMYLKESYVLEPPTDGWPYITPEIFQDMGKTDEVIGLLRHLPYIRRREDGTDADGAPSCTFADWEAMGQMLGRGELDCETCRKCSELSEDIANVPPSVVGLTYGGRNNDVFLLDVGVGTIQWTGCTGPIQQYASREPILDDPYDAFVPDEADWRAEGATWPITDLFEVLKDQFRKLCFVPIDSRTVWDIYARNDAETRSIIEMVKNIYREHGWPGMERYDKAACMKAIKTAIEANFPNQSDIFV